MLTTLSSRAVAREIMDLPDVEPAAHRQALRGLGRINRVSHAAGRMAIPIAAMARREGLTRLSVADIACGGGDVPVGVAAAVGRVGVAVDLTLLDRSPTALDHASKIAAAAGIASQTIAADALGEFPSIAADVVTNSLFLHHVPEPHQVVALLRQMRAMARRMVVISDLRRCLGGFLGAWVGCRLLSRSSIVHHDGPASVRAAWTIEELREFARDAGMPDARIVRCRPWRMLLIWESSPRGAA